MILWDKTDVYLRNTKQNYTSGMRRQAVFQPGGNCKYCNKFCKCLRALNAHEKRCLNNPSRIEWHSHPVSEETKQKISATAKVNKRSGGYREGSGRGKKGTYQGYYCDSSWELAYVIYNLEHDVKFERNTQTFEYEYEHVTHKYMPDWKIGEDFVEIKGYWTDQWQAKLDQFPKDKNLIILDKETIKPYLEYAISKYGNDFTRLYE